MNEHFVSDKAFDPLSAEKLTAAQEELYMASQWKLMWWKLKRHRLAMWSLTTLIFIYLLAD